MSAAERFERYMEHLATGLGHTDRHTGLRGYCTGLMLPLERKSVEQMAASIDPLQPSEDLLQDVAKFWSYPQRMWKTVSITLRCRWRNSRLMFCTNLKQYDRRVTADQAAGCDVTAR